MPVFVGKNDKICAHVLYLKFKSKIHNIAILLTYCELPQIRYFISKKSSVYISED